MEPVAETIGCAKRWKSADDLAAKFVCVDRNNTDEEGTLTHIRAILGTKLRCYRAGERKRARGPTRIRDSS